MEHLKTDDYVKEEKTLRTTLQESIESFEQKHALLNQDQNSSEKANISNIFSTSAFSQESTASNKIQNETIHFEPISFSAYTSNTSTSYSANTTADVANDASNLDSSADNVNNASNLDSSTDNANNTSDLNGSADNVNSVSSQVNSPKETYLYSSETCEEKNNWDSFEEEDTFRIDSYNQSKNHFSSDFQKDLSKESSQSELSDSDLTIHVIHRDHTSDTDSVSEHPTHDLSKKDSRKRFHFFKTSKRKCSLGHTGFVLFDFSSPKAILLTTLKVFSFLLGIGTLIHFIRKNKI